jgi:hypothetical protein
MTAAHGLIATSLIGVLAAPTIALRIELLPTTLEVQGHPRATPYAERASFVKNKCREETEIDRASLLTFDQRVQCLTYIERQAEAASESDSLGLTCASPGSLALAWAG